MSRRRAILSGIALLVVASYAAWAWWRPYDWQAARTAPCKIIAAQLRPDLDYAWLDLHLRSGESRVVLPKDAPPTLATARREGVSSADLRIDGRDLWLSFWLEPGDLDGPLTLQYGSSLLRVRTGSGHPLSGKTNPRTFTTHHW